MSEQPTRTSVHGQSDTIHRPVQSDTDPVTTSTRGETMFSGERNPEAVVLTPRVSWGAIIAGSVIGLAILFLLSLLGIGIGSAVIDPAQDANPLSGVGIGSGVFVIVAQLIALAAGGYIAARLAGVAQGMSSALHGAAVWALATFAMLFLATTTIGGLMGGAASMIGSASSGAVKMVQSAIPDDIGLGQIDQSSLPPAVQQAMEENNITPEDLQRQAETVFKSAVSENERTEIMSAIKAAAANIASSPSSAGEEMDKLVNKLVGENGGVLSDQDREQAIASLSDQLGISTQEAEQTLDQWQQQLTESVESAKAAIAKAQEDAVQAAQASSEAISKGALAAFGASLAGLIVAMVAGFFGRRTKVALAHGTAAS